MVKIKKLSRSLRIASALLALVGVSSLAALSASMSSAEAAQVGSPLSNLPMFGSDSLPASGVIPLYEWSAVNLDMATVGSDIESPTYFTFSYGADGMPMNTDSFGTMGTNFLAVLIEVSFQKNGDGDALFCDGLTFAVFYSRLLERTANSLPQGATFLLSYGNPAVNYFYGGFDVSYSLGPYGPSTSWTNVFNGLSMNRYGVYLQFPSASTGFPVKVFDVKWVNGWLNNQFMASYYKYAVQSVTDARNDGYNEGYGVGNAHGYSDGYSVGRSDGYNAGRTVGYDEGLAAGSSAGGVIMSLFNAAVGVPIDLFNGLSSFTVWGVPIITIALTFVAFGIVMYVVRKVI